MSGRDQQGKKGLHLAHAAAHRASLLPTQHDAFKAFSLSHRRSTAFATRFRRRSTLLLHSLSNKRKSALFDLHPASQATLLFTAPLHTSRCLSVPLLLSLHAGLFSVCFTMTGTKTTPFQMTTVPEYFAFLTQTHLRPFTDRANRSEI